MIVCRSARLFICTFYHFSCPFHAMRASSLLLGECFCASSAGSSRRPNCFAQCEGGTLKLKALHTIPPRSELTISYQPLEAAFMTRRAELQDAYYFDVAPEVHLHCIILARHSVPNSFWQMIRMHTLTGGCVICLHVTGAGLHCR